MPPGRDVGLATLFIQRDEEIGIDRRILVGEVDDPAGLRPVDVVDVGLVQRPGIDEALDAVLIVVYGPAIEPESLSGPVVVPGGEPCLFGCSQGLIAGIFDEGIDRLVHRGRAGEACLIRGVDQVGIVGNDLLLQGLR